MSYCARVLPCQSLGSRTRDLRTGSETRTRRSGTITSWKDHVEERGESGASMLIDTLAPSSSESRSRPFSLQAARHRRTHLVNPSAK
jgi:hypothetical protein